MKIGAENKKQLRIMIVLLAILLLVGIYNFVDFGTSSANTPAAAPATSTQTTQATRKSTSPTQLTDSTLDPRLWLDKLAASQNVKYEAGGRNIFRMEEVKQVAKTIASVRQPYGPAPCLLHRLQRRLRRRSRSSFTALPASLQSQKESFLTMKVKYSSHGRVTLWKESTR